jgi:hypothetical protein
MSVVTFNGRGDWYDAIPDVLAIGHELLHWLTNPYFDGETAPYRDPGPYAEPTWCGSDDYNVVDPIEWAAPITLADTALPYHLPDALLPRWFTHDVTARGDTGYSFWGNATSFGGPCVSDTAIAYEYFDAQPDASATVPIDINNAGEIAGYYFDAQSNPHGFVRRNGRTQEISVPGASATYPLAISNNHEIAGQYIALGASHGFYSSGGRLLTLDVPGAFYTIVDGIDVTGRLAGSYRNEWGVHGFVYERGRFTTIDLPGAAHTIVNAINDVGDIALSTLDADGTFVGSWIMHGTGGQPASVVFPGDTSDTGVANLDNRGRLIGSFTVNGHAAPDGFVRNEDGSFLRLLVSEANGINDGGQIVGTRLNSFRYRGFIARLPKGR